MTFSAKNTNRPEPMSKHKITREIQITDLISAYPFAAGFLMKKNLQCIICGEPVWGTLEELARDGQFTHLQTETLVEELIAEANIRSAL